MRSFWWPFTAAFLVGALVVGASTAVKFADHREAVAVGWKLIPVLVASTDLSPGTKLTQADVLTVEIPEQFVSDSNVIADDRSLLLDQAIEEPVLKGEPLMWSMFNRTEAAALNKCLEAIGPPAAITGTSAAEAVAAEFVKHRRAITASEVAQPSVANGTIRVLVVSRDIAEGQLIPLEALRAVALPEELFTASYVPSVHIRKIAGARAILAMSAGEPLAWQMLDDPDQPQSLTACRAAAAQAESTARATTSKALAQQHFAKGAQ